MLYPTPFTAKAHGVMHTSPTLKPVPPPSTFPQLSWARHRPTRRHHGDRPKTGDRAVGPAGAAGTAQVGLVAGWWFGTMEF